jgi:sn-1 stearoyl-lipid 9-desaturase
MQNVIEFDNTRRDKLNWNTIIAVSLFHLAAIPALFTFSWQNFAATAILWIIASSWGIGIGFHRLLTHRGFVASRWLTRFFAFCGTLALQSGPITWVTTHRMHHAFTETERDPHSPRNGTYWSHIGWIFRGTAQHQPQAIRERYSPDLLRDPVLCFLDKYYWVPSVGLAAILFAIGGWSMVVWALALRIVVSWHFTWAVNSVTHIVGSRRFETRDDSRNNGLVALFTFGEGWHNNHHAIPRSAKHGLTWKEVDFNWMQLWTMQKLGLIRDLYAYDIEAEAQKQTELRAAA